MSGMMFIVVFCVVLFVAVQAVVNTDVSQTIDATTSVVRYSADIKASEMDGKYEVVFQNDWANHLAFLSVTSKGGKTLTVQPPVRYLPLTLHIYLCYICISIGVWLLLLLIFLYMLALVYLFISFACIFSTFSL